MLLLRVFGIKCRDAPTFTRSYTDFLAAPFDASESLPPEKAAFLVEKRGCIYRIPKIWKNTRCNKSQITYHVL